MPITFGGMSSGLPANIVEQLMESERIPVRSLELKKSNTESKLKLVEELDGYLQGIRGSIGGLASTRGFQDIKLSTGDMNVVQGTVDASQAKPGSWNIEVMELAQKAAAVTNSFPDKDQTEIGVGYFKFETMDGDKEVYINGDNNTLEGAAKAINAARVGVTATVINDRKNPEEPYKLMLSGENVGSDSKIKYPTLYFLDGDQDLFFDIEKPAKNGVIKIDGFEFEVSSNTVKDVIPGVTLDLKQADPGKSVNVSVKEDLEVVSGKVKEFVDSMNKVFDFIQTQNRMDANTETKSTLGGDSMLRSIERRFRRLIQNTQLGIRGPIKRLSQLGIEFNRNGALSFKQDVFDNTLASNPDHVQAFLAGDGFNVGFIPSLKRNVKVVLDSNFGPIGNRKKSLTSKISQMDRRIEQKEKMLVKKEERLRKTFANLEAKVSKLKAQGGALSAMGLPPQQ